MMSSRRHRLVVLWRLGERLAFRVASGNIAENQQTGTKLLRDITSVIDGGEMFPDELGDLQQEVLTRVAGRASTSFFACGSTVRKGKAITKEVARYLEPNFS